MEYLIINTVQDRHKSDRPKTVRCLSLLPLRQPAALIYLLLGWLMVFPAKIDIGFLPPSWLKNHLLLDEFYLLCIVLRLANLKWAIALLISRHNKNVACRWCKSFTTRDYLGVSSSKVKDFGSYYEKRFDYVRIKIRKTTPMLDIPKIQIVAELLSNLQFTFPGNGDGQHNWQ